MQAFAVTPTSEACRMEVAELKQTGQQRLCAAAAGFEAGAAKVLAAATTSQSGKPMTKTAIIAAIATELDLTHMMVADVLHSLAKLVAKELKRVGHFTLPGIVSIKTWKKPATKACKKFIAGKERALKAKPAKTVVRAFPVGSITALQKRR